MNVIKVTVTGYSADRPCERVSKTFYVRDEAEFGERVLAWERENRIMEWSKDNRSMR
jgi:hypothetical protein